VNLTVYPSGPLQGEIYLPGDKSISHRAALFAALAQGKSRFENFLLAGVTRAMLNALSHLGICWKLDGAVLQIEGKGLKGFSSPNCPLDCGNSATTLRLLTGALAASGVPAVLDGSEGLRRRPMDRIVSPLKDMGVPIRASSGGTAPIYLLKRTDGTPLKAVNFRLPVASAQVKSCIMLAGLAADGPTYLMEPGPSRDHTERLLQAMGVSVWREADPGNPQQESFLAMLPPDRPLSPLKMRLPGDFSSAAFMIVAALISPGSDLIIKDVGLNPSRTGLLDALQTMGADIKVGSKGDSCGEPFGDISVKHSPLSGTSVSGELVVRMIDEFPAFAVAAANASGITVVSGAEELRHKESDRISALCLELRRLAVETVEKQDGFLINGGQKVNGGVINHHGDHRLAMSLLTAGLAASGPVTAAGSEIIAESYPSFTADLKALGACIEFEERS
jgi:3-phosphoshikimate 1-carboxyvinyltransferase